MAWDQHGQRRYYYRSRRVKGRSFHVYVGTGLIGERAAAEDQERRAQRQAERDAWRAAQQQVVTSRAVLDPLDDACSLVMPATLLLNGCYLHDRTWRRRHAAAN
jgi:hypothetical protein